MIEGEEIFESAEETGYRLCRRISAEPENGPELVFSATWDLNSPNRLHVCLQNGQLKVFDVDTHNCARFNLLFRRYTPVFENDSKTEKIVDTHWDKMTTIPDRPDEIVFLLGISQKLKYTALPPPEDDPYPERPLLASTARGDFPGFIFGSPVMEVASHPSRITSLCVSPAGHILASGDEFGNVRLLLLRLLDEISVFKQNERRRKKAAAATSFSKFLPTYNILVPAHEGPIFSMQWLPIMSCSESNNVRNYALVTGSVDRSVRIWRVSCCSARGITMTPAMSLDTLSTHVLSLNAFLYTDRFVLAKMNRMEAYTRNLSLNDSFASVFSLTPEERVEKKKMDVANGAKAIFLAAGTSVGTVYVWKIDYLEVMSCIAGREEPKAGTTPRSPRAGTPRNTPAVVVAEPPRTVVADDGTMLYSLMQTSDRPIIHVTLNAFPSDGVPLSPLNSPMGRQDMLDFAAASAGDVVLAASDTLGAVHIYAPEKLDPHAATPRTKGAVKELTELPHHPLYEEYRSRLLADDDVHKCFTAPLVRIGEQRFPAAVVACSFPPAYPQEELLNSLGTPGRSVTYAAPKTLADRWDPTEMSQRTGPLLVSNAQGEIILYSVSDLAALAQHHRDEMQHNTGANGDINSRGVVLSDVPRMRQDDDTISECSVDSDIRDSDRKMFQHRSGRKIKKMQQHHLERQGGAAGGGGGSGGSVSSEGTERSDVVWDKVVLKQMPRSPKSGSSNTKSTRDNTKANSTNNNTTTTNNTTSSRTAKKSTFLQQEQEDCSEYPRGPPPPPTPTTGTNTNTAKNTANNATRTTTTTNAKHNHLTSSVDTTNSTLPRPPLHVQLTVPQHSKYSWESPDSSAPSSPAGKHDQHSSTSRGSDRFFGEGFESMSAYSASAPSTPLPSPPKNFKKKVEKEVVEDARENVLAQPQITYSKLLEGQVQEMQQVIDNDEFSVSTQLTTKSDRLAAAAAARAAVSRHKRYAGLTPVQFLDGADMSMLLHEAGVGAGREKTKIAKQVDPEWLSNRKYGGPSAEDMAALEVPEPLVSLRLSHCHMHQLQVQPQPHHLATAGGAQGSVSGVNTSGVSGVGRRLPALSQSIAESVRTEKPSLKAAQEYKYNAEFGLRHATDPDTLMLKYRMDVNADQVYGRFIPLAAARLSAPKSEEFGRESLFGLISSVSL